MKRLTFLCGALALCFFLTACAAGAPDTSGSTSAGNSAQGALAGKRLSILGDSISSFDGVSNNSDISPALGGNEPFFPQLEIATEADTWWRQAVDTLGMQLLVNNSYSGGWVTADMAGLSGTSGIGRSTLLATDTATPDVIAFFMGANDCRFGKAPGSADAVEVATLPLEGGEPPADFATGYATALVRMQAAYPNAVIYACTLPAALADGCNLETIAAYNEVIRAVAAKLSCRVADFATDSGITYDTLSQDTLDGLHPNQAGMQKLADAFVRAVQAG